MTSYQVLRKKPGKLMALTGHTPEEFSALVPYFSKRFLEFVETKTLDGKPRKKRKYTPYKNSRLPSSDLLGSSIKATSDEALFLELAMRGYDLTQLKESETHRITRSA